MSLLAPKSKSYPAIIGLEIQNDSITAIMSDGRAVSIPIAWFDRLANATREQLENFEISGGGYGIHWSDIDEDISVKAFLD